MQQKVQKTDRDWKAALAPEQYRVLRCSETERPFTGKYWDHHGTGVYRCAGCGLELFGSEDKFESGTGWPSFRRPIADGRVAEKSDHSFGMRRTEAVCPRCGGHLGHVFDDGPAPTGLRYCINSAALDFTEQNAQAQAETPDEAVATFGAGCFWCSEAAFSILAGVESVEVGYMGGNDPDPTYAEVCSGKTGHAEVCRVTYDPARVSYETLLEVFWSIHDPTSLNRQGADVGTQYRSAIFFYSDDQRKAAELSRDELQQTLRKKIVTEIVPAGAFHEAEASHQDYFERNPSAPYCRAVIAPKVKKLRKSGELELLDEPVR